MFELRAYMSVTTSTSLVVDELIDEVLRVNFNVTLYEAPCEYLSVDVSDMTVSAHHDSSHLFGLHHVLHDEGPLPPTASCLALRNAFRLP